MENGDLRAEKHDLQLYVAELHEQICDLRSTIGRPQFRTVKKYIKRVTTSTPVAAGSRSALVRGFLSESCT